MGIYDQLENLNKPSPAPEAPVASPDPSKVARTATSGQAPIPSKSHAKKSPTASHSQAKTDTSQSTLNSTSPRDRSREMSRESQRENSHSLPSREEIQEFSFHLRDELRIKVQAEVPHQWQDELEEISRQLDVKKLELYRFILGEFLGKVKRKKSA
jgi:hypothetical protein